MHATDTTGTHARVTPDGTGDGEADVRSPLLELAGVDLSYRLPGRARLDVLRSVNLRVQPGRMVCIAGRSGSGKTSLLYTAARLLPVDRGSVRWSGEDVTRLTDADASARRRQLIGFVFQTAGLVELLTAQENVALPGLPRGERDAKSRSLGLLGKVGLEARARHFPAQLSGGERQRVAIARALFHDPPLLLVDEPTASLDRDGARTVIDLLRTLRDDGHALIIASHDEHVIDASDETLRLD